MVMTYFFNIYINVDIFTIVFYLPYYCNIRYIVLSLDEIKTHYYYYYYYYYYRHTNPITYITVESMFLPTLDGICKFEALNKNKKKHNSYHVMKMGQGTCLSRLLDKEN